MLTRGQCTLAVNQDGCPRFGLRGSGPVGFFWLCLWWQTPGTGHCSWAVCMMASPGTAPQRAGPELLLTQGVRGGSALSTRSPGDAGTPDAADLHSIHTLTSLSLVADELCMLLLQMSVNLVPKTTQVNLILSLVRTLVRGLCCAWSRCRPRCTAPSLGVTLPGVLICHHPGLNFPTCPGSGCLTPAPSVMSDPERSPCALYFWSEK